MHNISINESFIIIKLDLKSNKYQSYSNSSFLFPEFPCEFILDCSKNRDYLSLFLFLLVFFFLEWVVEVKTSVLASSVVIIPPLFKSSLVLFCINWADTLVKHI
jgi:hypothetical protein